MIFLRTRRSIMFHRASEVVYVAESQTSTVLGTIRKKGLSASELQMGGSSRARTHVGGPNAFPSIALHLACNLEASFALAPSISPRLPLDAYKLVERHHHHVRVHFSWRQYFQHIWCLPALCPVSFSNTNTKHILRYLSSVSAPSVPTNYELIESNLDWYHRNILLGN